MPFPPIPRTLTRVGRLLIDGPVTEHKHNTGEVTISGLGQHGTQVGAVWFREQIAALADNSDEPVIPVTVPGGWSGFGLVTGASTEPLAMSDGYQRWSVTVTPVRNPGTPIIESGLLQYLRDNANGATSSWLHAVPAKATAYSWVPETGTATVAERITDPMAPGSTGNVWLRQVGSGGGGTTSAMWSVHPDDYYGGSCYAERLVGPSWLPTIGRRSIPDEGWRVGNGLVRFTVEGPSLTIQWFRPDQAGSLNGWSNPYRWHLRRTDVPAQTNWIDYTAFEVTELTAHKVTVRFAATSMDGRCSVWASIIRGTRTVYFYVDSDVPDPRPWIAPTVATTMTDNTYYAQSQTFTSDGGVRWLYMAAGDFSVGTSSGICGPSAATAAQWPFGISAVLTGDTGSGGNAAVAAREWYSPIAERVVFR